MIMINHLVIQWLLIKLQVTQTSKKGYLVHLCYFFIRNITGKHGCVACVRVHEATLPSD